MKKIDIDISMMQKEVWRMKENTYKETKHLNAGEFFCYIKDKLAGKRVNGFNTLTREHKR